MTKGPADRVLAEAGDLLALRWPLAEEQLEAVSGMGKSMTERSAPFPERLVIRAPETEQEFADVFDLRWRVLRRPWDQPRGSERDDREDEARHLMALLDGRVVGVGRIHFPDEKRAQIRFMAVDPDCTGRGIGSRLLKGLEDLAREGGVTLIELNAREGAVSFYRKSNYEETGEGPLLWGRIRHVVMRRVLGA